MTIEMHQQSKMVSCESGQTMTEYSLVLGLIVLVTIATSTDLVDVSSRYSGSCSGSLRITTTHQVGAPSHRGAPHQ